MGDSSAFSPPDSAAFISLSERPASPSETLTHPESATYGKRCHEAMQSVKLYMPPLHALEALLLSGGAYTWHLWADAFPRQVMLDRQQSAEDRVAALCALVYTTIHCEKPGPIAKVLLCLVLHIQQLPIGAQQSSATLQRQCLDSVDALLTPDNSFAESVEGIECMLLKVEIFICQGKLRKVWLQTKTALALAQMLDLPAKESSVRTPGRRLWSRIWQLDRGFSMITGLPCATMDSQYPQIPPDMHEELYLYQLGLVMGRISERNQSAEADYAVTLEIDKALEKCRACMPLSWWQSNQFDTSSPQEIFAENSKKIRFHTTRRLLHLPFMLKGYNNPQFEPSRLATLEASAALISYYRRLREEDLSALKMCDMADFEVFCAALTITIDLLCRARPSDEARRSWQSVVNVAHDLHRVSEHVSCAVAAKAAKVLLELSAARHQWGLSTSRMTLDIPYFGRICIRQWPVSNYFSQDDSNTQSPQQTSELAEPANKRYDASLEGWCFPYPSDRAPRYNIELGISTVPDFDDTIDWSWFLSNEDLGVTTLPTI